ncbi:MAG: hypothetical protein ACLPXT_12000 [Terracidiphilus sp.]
MVIAPAVLFAFLEVRAVAQVFVMTPPAAQVIMTTIHAGARIHAMIHHAQDTILEHAQTAVITATVHRAQDTMLASAQEYAQTAAITATVHRAQDTMLASARDHAQVRLVQVLITALVIPTLRVAIIVAAAPPPILTTAVIASLSTPDGTAIGLVDPIMSQLDENLSCFVTHTGSTNIRWGI